MDWIERLEKGNVQFAILLILLAFYLLTKSVIFAVLTALFIVAAVGIEVYVGIKKHGVRKEVLETIATVIVALLLWFGFQRIMNTETPISAIVSCSMLPSLDRGDLIFVKGIERYNAPILHVTSKDINSLKGLSNVYKGDEYLGSIPGSIMSYCQATLEGWCVDFANNPSNYKEVKGNFTFQYKKCTRKFLGLHTEKEEPCLAYLQYGNKKIFFNKSNDVLVYRPTKAELFGMFGDIVHRAFVLLMDEKGNEYYLTQGDNNNVMDIQFYSYKFNKGNYPIKKSNVLGKVVFRVPYLGYYKLFLSLYFTEDPLCNTVLIRG